MLDNNACVETVFLDLKNAFYIVHHEILLFKLTSQNLSLDEIQWI